MSENTLFSVENTHSQPLAARMRPRNLDEYIGQDHSWKKDYKKSNSSRSTFFCYFYGPGKGK